MTGKETIKYLIYPTVSGTDIGKEKQKELDAYNMAIKALEQKPCEDAISRQAVLKTLDDMDNVLDEDRTIENYKELLKECYEVLPSVKSQEPKTGHWIRGKYKDTCNHCRCTYPKNIGFKNYCPNCGMKMQAESEDKE